MRNYKNTPRVRQLQKQSRIQSLTSVNTVNPKQSRKSEKYKQYHQKLTVTNQSQKSNNGFQWIQQSRNQSHKPTNSNNQSNNTITINQYNIGYAPNKQKISHNIQISQKQQTQIDSKAAVGKKKEVRSKREAYSPQLGQEIHEFKVVANQIKIQFWISKENQRRDGERWNQDGNSPKLDQR